MTNSEYQELVEFLGQKFDEVDRRFDQTATKDEMRAQQAETRRHFEVVAEGMRGQLQQVAEGLVNLDQKLDRFREEVETEFQIVYEPSAMYLPMSPQRGWWGWSAGPAPRTASASSTCGGTAPERNRTFRATGWSRRVERGIWTKRALRP